MSTLRMPFLRLGKPIVSKPAYSSQRALAPDRAAVGRCLEGVPKRCAAGARRAYRNLEVSGVWVQQVRQGPKEKEG